MFTSPITVLLIALVLLMVLRALAGPFDWRFEVVAHRMTLTDVQRDSFYAKLMLGRTWWFVQWWPRPVTKPKRDADGNLVWENNEIVFVQAQPFFTYGKRSVVMGGVPNRAV